jgi:hypothetical protein
MIVALVLACASTAVAAQDTIGFVKRANGEVFVQRGGERIKAEKGTPLYRGDRVLTGRSAYAYLEVQGAAPLAIGPETDVSVDRFSGDNKQDNKQVSRHSAPRLVQGLASYFALNRQR